MGELNAAKCNLAKEILNGSAVMAKLAVTLIEWLGSSGITLKSEKKLAEALEVGVDWLVAEWR